MTVLAIDIGNTLIKVGEFDNDKLRDVHKLNESELKDAIGSGRITDADVSIISSVVHPAKLKEISNLFKNTIIIDSNTSLPFNNHYQSPETLGIDRICNASYAFAHMNTEYAVVIDLGTCLKFDLISKSEGYLGGSISPGIDLRYKSLNEHTGNLPLVSNKSHINHVGTTTEESIHSGVINGIQAEIRGLMDDYSRDYKDLTFFVTGGDLSNFDLGSKNDIFADENLTLKGLYEIYKSNS